MEYRIAKERARIGAKVMEEHHEHLLGVRVEFLFMNKTPKSKGRHVWGRARKIGGLNAFLALGPNWLPEAYEDQPFDFFVIEVSEEVWETLTERGKRALIDHELTHCAIEEDEDGFLNLSIVGHSIEEFETIVRRHGLWRQDLRDFVKTGAEQLSFDAIDETGGVVEGGDGLDVSITPNGRTVHTNTETMNRMTAGEVPSGVGS